MVGAGELSEDVGMEELSEVDETDGLLGAVVVVVTGGSVAGSVVAVTELDDGAIDDVVALDASVLELTGDVVLAK